MGPIELKANLIFLYHAMVASENLLSVAASRLRPGPLREYYTEHLAEESGHERWLAEDLASVGIDVARTKLPIEVLEMVGSVYYLIYHVHPCALLGYMRAMEGTPTPMKQIEYYESIYPRSLVRTLRYHAEHDPEHARRLEEVIERCSEGSKMLINQTAAQSRVYLTRAIRRLEEGSQCPH